MRTILEFQNVSFAYHKKEVLKQVSFSIKEGGFVSVLGKNGCGKTTLMKIILGILKADRGEIQLMGKESHVYSKKELTRLFSYVPQFVSIEFDLPVLDFVLLGCLPHIGRFSEVGRKELEQALAGLEQVGLLDSANVKMNRLSGGERQKVFIAKALAQDTPLILLDEPISHLDWQNQVEILDLLKELTLQPGKEKMIISILHDVNLAAVYSDFVLFLKDGKVFDSGKVEEVITVENIRMVYQMEVRNVERYFIPLGKYR